MVPDPELNDLLDETQGLDRPESVIAADYGTQLVYTRLAVTRLVVLPGDRAQDFREIVVVIRPIGHGHHTAFDRFQVPLVLRAALALDAKVDNGPGPVLEDLLGARTRHVHRFGQHQGLDQQRPSGG